MDLATADGVLSYLADTPFASDTVTRLSGGYGNYTFRLHLRTAYAGQTTAVLKHGKPYVPGMETIFFSVDRQKYEVATLSQMKEIIPADSLVSVPDVYILDEDAGVIIMSDCGEDTVTLKAYIQNEPRAHDTAELIGRELGSVLARLHIRGSADPHFLDSVRANKGGREISAWVTYGRVVSTLTEEPPAKLQDPLLNFPDSLIKELAGISLKTQETILTTEETLVVGDFWPGNVLVRVSKDDDVSIERLFIIDCELAKPGLAGLDVGQFCAELVLLQRFDQGGAAASGVICGFLEGYRGERGADLHVAGTALAHVGAHLITWTPRINWGGKERTREVVMEGVGYMLEGSRKDPAIIEQSIVRTLV